jgi:hypothetical protein
MGVGRECRWVISALLSDTIPDSLTIIHSPDYPLASPISLASTLNLRGTITFPLRIDLFSLLGIMRLDLFLGFIHWVLEDRRYTQSGGSGSCLLGPQSDLRSRL